MGCCSSSSSSSSSSGGKDNSNEDSGCCASSCCGNKSSGGDSEKLQAWKQKKTQLVDYKFKDVDTSKFRDTSMKGIRQYIQMLTASMNYFLFIALDVQIIFYLFEADPNEYPKAMAGGIAYAILTGISFFYLGYNIYKAYQIIQSDDISDAFLHHEAYRIRNIMSYDVFCFFTQLTKKRSCKDKTVLYVSDSLYQLPQIIAIKAPQMAIMMVNNDVLHVFSDSKNGIPKSQTSADMKFAVLVLELWLRAFAVFILYPWIKCCKKQDDVPQYANYLVESRINNLVKSGKAGLNEEEEEEDNKGGCC